MNKKNPKLKKLPKYAPGGVQNPSDPNRNWYDDSSNIDSSNNGMTSGQAVTAGTAIGSGAIQGYYNYSNPNNSSIQKTRGLQSGVDTAEIGVASAINPVLGAGIGAVKKIGNSVQSQADKTNSARQLINPNASKVGEVAGGFLDPANSLIGIYSDPHSTTGEKVAGSLTGGLSDMFTNRHRKQVEYSAQYQNDQQYRMGGRKKPIFSDFLEPSGMYGTPVQMANGGYMEQYPDGGDSNAEVEKQEVMRAPDGSTMQTNGPSHENGGVPVNIPNGTQIYSDRLKMPGTKKTFAQIASKYKVDKQDKILDNPNATTSDVATAKLVAQMKQKKLSELFSAQENLKQSKVAQYAKKMGVTLPKPKQDEPEQVDNSQEESQEMAYGGYFDYNTPHYNTEYNTPYEYASGGIHIKPSHVGRFTAYKQRTGKTTEEALHSSNAHVRQMANFAKNAAGWKHAYGGVQKYDEGGFFGENTNGPRSGQEDIPNNNTFYTNDDVQQYNPNYVMQSPSDYYKKQDNPSYNPDNYYGQQNSSASPDRITQPITKYNPDDYVNSLRARDNKPRYDYSQFIKPGVNTLVQNAGNLAYLHDQGKKYDRVNYGNIKANLLDPSAALRDADIQASVSRNSLKDATNGNSGAYLAAASQVGAQNTLNKAKIRNTYQNQNAEINNQTDQYNKNNYIRGQEAEAANKGASMKAYYDTITNIGERTSAANRNYNQDQSQNYVLDLISKQYPDYQYDKNRRAWYNKQGQKLVLGNK